MEDNKLPLGLCDFTLLRDSGRIYVDKTDLIFELASNYGRFFLSRPRRFGKSLLVSTFETLFKDGLKYFGGLKISDRWDDKTYGVVKLDFSKIKENDTIADMRKEFDGILKPAFARVGFVYNPDNSMTALEQIDAWLEQREPSSLVLLVDEYDAPLNSHLDNPEFFNQIRNMLSGFFLRIKASDRAWRFIFITGIAKFNKASIFSAFNNLTDISLDPQFGTLLGYTEQEILGNFKLFVDNAARVNNMEVSALMAAMRTQYDGFCFDEDAATHVYAPWSVLSFLSAPKRGLRDFWYGSASGSSMVKNYLDLHPFTNPIESFGEDIPVSIDKLRDSNDAKTLSPAVFLFQAGYLSIKQTDTDTDMAYLNFPNGEVRQAMNRLMAEQLLKSKSIVDADLSVWIKAAKAGDVTKLVAAMNGTFNQIDYIGFPLTHESHVRAAAQIYLLSLKQGATVEKHYAEGRSDLEFDAGDYHWVMEFKYAYKDRNDNPDTLLASALNQIKEKRYGEGLNIGDRKLMRVGLVFDEKARQFVRYGVA